MIAKYNNWVYSITCVPQIINILIDTICKYYIWAHTIYSRKWLQCIIIQNNLIINLPN